MKAHRSPLRRAAIQQGTKAKGTATRLLVPFVFGLLPFLYWIVPLAAQEIIDITNTASGGFRASPDGEVQTTSSNATNLSATIAPASLEIIKSGDRASGQPGDLAIYRITVNNTGATTVDNLLIQDTLPFGFQFLPESLEGTFTNADGATVEVALAIPEVDGRDVTIPFPSLAPEETLNIVYGVVLTPDAMRGEGRNVVAVVGSSGAQQIASNTATFQVRVRAGIFSDCGTIVGRVFVDGNFDGEQQSGEPGVPNAVLIMDDGNRITTDVNGLFSVGCVLSGYRSATLDLNSIPEYTLAPNRYRIEKNSLSRMVRLEPGGMVRMNFAVTPAFDEQ
ncbi:MAG: DUF11 domain-containing protein [Coleofasciculaceae cyanobacterium SM2_3_26]|nr:DUF11 domain-containing protein [Coleofasciculaceae cyanobacterium SM2_3_26]